jgi:hypothetical protein
VIQIVKHKPKKCTFFNLILYLNFSIFGVFYTYQTSRVHPQKDSCKKQICMVCGTHITNICTYMYVHTCVLTDVQDIYIHTHSLSLSYIHIYISFDWRDKTHIDVMRNRGSLRMTCAATWGPPPKGLYCENPAKHMIHNTYIHTRTYITYIYAHIHTYINTYIHTYVHNTYIYTYIHTYRQTDRQKITRRQVQFKYSLTEASQNRE